MTNKKKAKIIRFIGLGFGFGVELAGRRPPLACSPSSSTPPLEPDPRREVHGRSPSPPCFHLFRARVYKSWLFRSFHPSFRAESRACLALAPSNLAPPWQSQSSDLGQVTEVLALQNPIRRQVGAVHSIFDPVDAEACTQRVRTDCLRDFHVHLQDGHVSQGRRVWGSTKDGKESHEPVHTLFESLPLRSHPGAVDTQETRRQGPVVHPTGGVALGAHGSPHLEEEDTTVDDLLDHVRILR